MILICLLLGIVLFIVGFLLLPTKRQRFIGGGLGLLLLVAMATLMIGNDNWHWGMHQVTTTTTVKIASISPSNKVNLLVYQPIRQANKERVYVYQLAGQTAQRHTAASVKLRNRVRYQAVRQAKLTTATTRWTYNNDAWRWLFSWTGQHHNLVRRQNTFTLPTSWSTLSTRQAKWLAKAVASKEAAAKKTTTKAVTAAVLAAKQAQPTLTTTQLMAVQTKAERAAQQQAQQQTATVLASLLKQAKAQPVK
ncbi:DUF4811 domain-containing protein [Levilactobacillus cerevisiae]|uniref:DUF4811 domain-containing protein n=1 Tax=Levilactobacillus cerevisiae TaxID=1704076 RepID=UPI000F7A3232|nr:DUF4811 domain-containing protein [Levilactobacillus cerevisiae]